MDGLDALRSRIRDFAHVRDWEQFHTPRNLVMAMTGEVGELAAEMQWISDDEIASRLVTDSDFRSRVEGEVADVFIYLLRLADVTDIDLEAVAREKVERNEQRYPADRARGSTAKFPAYED